MLLCFTSMETMEFEIGHPEKGRTISVGVSGRHSVHSMASRSIVGSRASAGGEFGKVISLLGNRLSQSPREPGESGDSICTRVPAVETAVTVGRRQRRVESPKEWSAWLWMM